MFPMPWLIPLLAAGFALAATRRGYAAARRQQVGRRPQFLHDPVYGPVQVNAGWGGNLWLKRNHKALDIIAKKGAPIRAVAPGIVTMVVRKTRGDAGLEVRVKHDLPGIGTVVTRYAHLSSIPGLLKKGSVVEGGETIGRSGATGRAHGAHLHFELWVCGPQALANYIRFFGVPKRLDAARAKAGKCTKVPAEPLMTVSKYNRGADKVSRSLGVRI